MSNFEKLIAAIVDRVMGRLERKLQEIADGNPRICPRLLTAKQAANYLGRSEAAIRQLVAKKSLPVVRVGRRTHFDRQALDLWVRRNRSK